MRRRALGSMLVIGLCAASCTGAAPVAQPSSPAGSTSAESTSPSPTATPALFRADVPARARRVAGGCGSTQAYRGPVPAWLEEADGQNTPEGLPYVIARQASAAAFIFGYPLRAGHSADTANDTANKILWVVRTPREGAPLHIEAHPRRSSAPVLTETRPADSGPGEIYPDGLDVPTAGCWHFTLRWQTGRAELDLEYMPGH